MDPLRSKTTRLISMLALAGVLVLAASPAVLAAGASGLRVVGYQVVGNVVLVTLQNAGSSSAHGTVGVQAMVAGTSVWGSSSTTVSAGGTTTVAVPFGGFVQQVIQVGMTVDDGSPL